MADNLPIVIQGSGKPCFRCDVETDATLDCASGCGQVLIENYFPEIFVNIAIKCFNCCSITRTSGLDPGDVLSNRILNFGEKGEFLLNSTVNIPDGVILTCDHEIRRQLEFAAPRPGSFPLDLSEDGIRDLVEQYDQLIGGKFALQREKIERSGANGARELPFAWAVVHLERCIRADNLNLKHPDTVTAVTWLSMFRYVNGIWGHHPRFQVVGRDLGKPNSFLHTASQFITAAYLFQVGNLIGFSIEDEHGKPNPDLYIKIGLGYRFFLEVKSPKYLQYGSCNIVVKKLIEKTLKNCIKKSSGQINRSHRGILIISSSYMSHSFRSNFQDEINNCLRAKGRDHKYLAAVVGISPEIKFSTVNGILKYEAAFHFSVTPNDHYDGKNPVETGNR